MLGMRVVVGHLLKNGPDCNKPELLIAMGYVVRGVARLKGLPTVPDATLQFCCPA